MNLFCFKKTACGGLSLVLSGCMCATGSAQAVQSTVAVPSAPVVAFDRQEVSAMRVEGLPESELQIIAKMPPSFHYFGAARVGEVPDVEMLTLRFAATGRLTEIASTRDFKIEPGGSCVEGDSYEANSACTVLVRFTPQGPGHRLGKLTATFSGGVRPASIGLGGYGSSPVVSFTPAAISTLPGTYASGAGIFSGALNLAVDGGDTLYVADTGHNLIRFMNSTGVFQSIPSASTIQAPIGILADPLGNVIFTQNSNPDVIQLLTVGGGSTYIQNGSTSCGIGSTCFLRGSAWSGSGALATDPVGNLFMSVSYGVARLVNLNNFGQEQYIPLHDLYSINVSNQFGPTPVAVDANDRIYTYFEQQPSSYSVEECLISSEGYYSALNQGSDYVRVAGGRGCGFSGDGGQAANALIGTAVGQMNFDLAGNFYFSDTNNQRVRRVEATTGIIRTIAGDGVAGYSGDGGPADGAALRSPTGVAVDTQGQVYILSNSASTGAAQVIRKLGPNGALSFPGLQLKGTASATRSVNVANTGNAPLVFTRAVFTGVNPGDFSIDSNVTTCNFAAGNSLSAGRSCRLGVIFKPGDVGARTANLVLTDNTVTDGNTIQLQGTGGAAVSLSAFSISPNVVNAGQSSTATVTLTAAAPTGGATVTISSDNSAAHVPASVVVAAGATTAHFTITTTSVSTTQSTHISASYGGVTLKAAFNIHPAT